MQRSTLGILRFRRILRLLSNNKDNLYGHMTKGVSGTFFLKVSHTGLMFVTALVLARILGPRGYGAYAYSIAWIVLFGVPAGLGLAEVTTRNIASYLVKHDWSLIRGLLRFSGLSVISTSISFAFIGAGLAWIAIAPHQNELRFTLLVAFFVLPLQVVSAQWSAALRGFQRVVKAQLPSLLIGPITFLVLIGAVFLLYSERMTAGLVMGLYFASSALLLGTALYFLHEALPRAIRVTPAKYEIRAWMRSAVPLALAGGLGLVNMNVDVLMLGTIKGSEMAGIYRAATRASDLVIFSLLIINPSLGPIVARLHAADDRARLQRVITKAARVALIPAIPIALFLILFGSSILLLFGSQFRTGNIALGILGAAQLVNVAAGSVGLILIMTGRETKVAAGMAISTVVNVMLNALLIPTWGMEGAAAATGAGIVAWNLILLREVRVTLGLDATFVGMPARRARQ